MMPKLFKRRRTPGRDERGAVALEFAVVVPLLAMLAFGAVEMGSAWSDSQTVLTSSRTAARSMAQFGDDPQADREALVSINAAFASTNMTVDAVIVYESDDAVNSGAAPTVCLDAARAGTPYNGVENCNVYAGADYATAVSAAGPASFGCGGGSLDNNWCPTSQRTRNQADATFVGVQVLVSRTAVTGADFVPVPTSLNQFSVMRMEPFPS